MPKKNTEKDTQVSQELSEEERQQQLEQQLLEQEEKNILKQSQEAFNASNKNKQILTDLFEYFRIDYNGTTTKEAHRFESSLRNLVTATRTNFIQNVYPSETRNFELVVSDQIVDKVAPLYYATQTKEDIKTQLRIIFEYISEVIRHEIDASEFHSILPVLVEHYFVSQGVCLVEEAENVRGRKSSLSFTPILPFQVAYQFNRQQQIIGIYYRFNDTNYQNNTDNGEATTATNLIAAVRKVYEEADKDGNVFLKYKWVVYHLEDDKLVSRDVRSYCPFITFYDVKFPLENRGRGIAFDMYDTIMQYERDYHRAVRAKDFAANPITLVDSASILPVKDKWTDIRAGAILEMNNPSLPARPLFNIDPTPFIHSTEEKRVMVTEGILGSLVNQNPSTTATLTQEQVNQRNNFIYQQMGRGAKQLMEQLVTTTFHILYNMGIIKASIIHFLLEDQDRIPYSVYQEMSKVSGDKQTGILNDFIDTLLEYILEPNDIPISITSPLGLLHKRSDYQEMIRFISDVTSITQQPVQLNFNIEKLRHDLAGKANFPASLLTTEREREALLQQQMQLQQQNQQQ